VFSQIGLSLVLPVPMIALLVLSSKRSVMGAFTARRRVIVGAAFAIVLVVGLNLVLIAQALASN
jgi:manganese transport protein